MGAISPSSTGRGLGQRWRRRPARPRCAAAAAPSAPRCRIAMPRRLTAHARHTTLEMALAARVPTLRNQARPGQRRDLDRHQQLVRPPAACAGSRCKNSVAGTRRSPPAPTSTSVASAASSIGTASAAGEALATLPPSVARFWICTPADLPRGLGQTPAAAAAPAAEAAMSANVAPAPMTSPPPTPRAGSRRSSRSPHRSRNTGAGQRARVQRHVQIGAPRQRQQPRLVAAGSPAPPPA